MLRISPFLLLLLCLALAAPAPAQDRPKRSVLRGWTTSATPPAPDARPRPGPETAAPQRSEAPAATVRPEPPAAEPGWKPAPSDLSALPDTLSEAEIARRLALLYRAQSELLEAEAAADPARTERLLEAIVAGLGALADRPEVRERERFRALYRLVFLEHERLYQSAGETGPEVGDIFAFREEAFAALENRGGPLLEDVLPVVRPEPIAALPAPVAPVFSMDYNRLVEQSISFLLRTREKHLYRWMERAETYFPMIESVFREIGVPDELKYLAMLESALVPHAVSRAKAVGMWQFMAYTGRAYGLEITHWTDDRKDPEKATRAAARHLKDLHKMFGGDWQLALAGYNCSPARIRRALRRAEARLGRKATFWDIYNDIPRETRDYVPMFIATALVASNPTAFGLQAPVPGPRFEFDVVTVDGGTTFREIAQLSGVDADTIRALNASFLQAQTPPGGGSYAVRLPLGSAARFASAYRPGLRKVSVAARHRVRRGDTITRIANQYGISVAELKRANGMETNTVRTGETLRIPGSQEPPEESGALASAAPASVRYGGWRRFPIHLAASAAGSRLPRLDGSGASAEVARGVAPEPAAERPVRRTGTAERAATPAPATRHTVRRGETLGGIAARYGVSVSDLRRWNGLRGSHIEVGQRLALRGGGSTAAPVRKASTVTHRVRRGDTLTEVARRYGVSVSDVKRWNGLRSSTIRIGQRLKIQK